MSDLPPSAPQISVVVPARNAAGTLPRLLASLAAQTLAPERFEVVVVDNGSRDLTAQVAASHGAVVVQDALGNRARARNLGVARASAPLVAFTDADCMVDDRWLEAYLEHEWTTPMVAGPVKVCTGDSPNDIERFERLWRFGQESWVREGWAATANLAVRRDAFDAVGGFDPSWRYIGEDADFCIRAGRAGLALGWCPNALVKHAADHSLRPLLERSYRHGYSVNQAYYRLGLGERAWRDPTRAIIGDRALRAIGHEPSSFELHEWRRMARLARLAYAARVVGSLWAELQRAR